MQAAGSLRKRRRRNLAKVTGLGALGYDENGDSFDISNLYGGVGIEEELEEAELRFSSATTGVGSVGGQRQGRLRVTREPPPWPPSSSLEEDLEQGWNLGRASSLASFTAPPGG